MSPGHSSFLHLRTQSKCPLRPRILPQDMGTIPLRRSGSLQKPGTAVRPALVSGVRRSLLSSVKGYIPGQVIPGDGAPHCGLTSSGLLPPEPLRGLFTQRTAPTNVKNKGSFRKTRSKKWTLLSKDLWGWT